MKYEKATAIIIDLGEEDIITASTNPASDCSNAASKIAANCTSGTYKSYQTCTSSALFDH